MHLKNTGKCMHTVQHIPSGSNESGGARKERTGSDERVGRGSMPKMGAREGADKQGHVGEGELRGGGVMD